MGVPGGWPRIRLRPCRLDHLTDHVDPRRECQAVRAVHGRRRTGFAKVEVTVVVGIDIDHPARQTRFAPVLETVAVAVHVLETGYRRRGLGDLQVVLVHLPHAAAVDLDEVVLAGGGLERGQVEVGRRAVAGRQDHAGRIAYAHTQIGRAVSTRGYAGARRHYRADFDRASYVRDKAEEVAVRPCNRQVRRGDRSASESPQGRRGPHCVVVRRRTRRVVVHVRVPDPQLVLGIVAHDTNFVNVRRVNAGCR